MNPGETVNKREIGEVRNGPYAVLKVGVGDFHGRTYVYLQTWEKAPEETGPGVPRGSRGLAIRPETLEELVPLLQEAVRAGLRRRQEQGS